MMKLFTLIAILKTNIFSLENIFDEKANISEPILIYKTLTNISSKKLPDENKDSSTIREFVSRLLSLENIAIEEKTIEELESFLGSELLIVCAVCETIKKISEAVEEVGGLHVCVSFFPKNLRVELQAVGRTAKLVLHSRKTVETLKKERETELFESEEEYRRKVRELVYLGDKVEEFCKFVRTSALSQYSKENVFRTALLLQMNENWCVFLLRNKHYLVDNKEAFDSAYEEFLESLRKNPDRITNIHYLLRAVNESTPGKEGYDLAVEKLMHCLIGDPPGEGSIDVQRSDLRFIYYFNKGKVFLIDEKKRSLSQAIFSFECVIGQIREYAIPFSLQKQRNFKEDDKNFEYYSKKTELLENILNFVGKLIDICEQIQSSKKKYKVTKVEVKQALYGDDSIDTMLEENIKDLAGKGLRNLLTIQELPPTIGDKILKVITISSIVFDIFMIIGFIVDVQTIKLFPFKLLFLICISYVCLFCIGEDLIILKLLKKGKDRGWLYWVCNRVFQSAFLLSYFCVRGKRINTWIDSITKLRQHVY